MSVMVSDCIDDLVTRLSEVEGLEGRVFFVMSDQELLDKTKGLMYTCVAVVYNGITASGEEGYTKKGISGMLMVDVLLFFRGNPQAQLDPKYGAISYLNKFRNALRVRSPTGHYWQFMSEVPIELKTGLMGYLQRWTTPVQLINV